MFVVLDEMLVLWVNIVLIFVFLWLNWGCLEVLNINLGLFLMMFILLIKDINLLKGGKVVECFFL